MELENKVMGLLKEAMKSKDEGALRALRAIKGAIIIAKTDKGAGEMTAEKEINILQKLAKQRRESIEIFTKQGVLDLATKEKEELDVIEQFLPAMLTEDEIRPILQSIIAKLNVTDAKGMGQVMGAATKELSGKADGSIIGKIVKELLS
ncbi:MAG: GatB/YqeY domain-containing protein [Chitinophagales bacterium]